ncbi:type 1 fimbrial protein [Paraburkholderia bengalensis]|uniref:Type 1 fimbrial protein n=1 Tax=Paraburkholderia bengalensis TaxID=2747562 RepID=A0ABU8IYK6_9BURK
MNNKHLFAMIVAGIGLASQGAFASDGNITFIGKITDTTCQINGNGTGNKDFTVKLPTVQAPALGTADQTAGRTSFNIALSNCSPATGTVHTYFEPGTTVDLQTYRLLNATGTGAATNVELELLNSNQTVIKVGATDASQGDIPQSISSGAANLNYFVQYHATGGAATSGTVNSSVMYSLSYQ